ncbi:MAG: hypothetical protein JW913_20105 [Chitinispirillaceae bacterium]|nr:hypothetical protein [Chitinispirillaceae bacterium]
MSGNHPNPCPPDLTLVKAVAFFRERRAERTGKEAATAAAMNRSSGEEWFSSSSMNRNDFLIISISGT